MLTSCGFATNRALLSPFSLISHTCSSLIQTYPSQICRKRVLSHKTHKTHFPWFISCKVQSKLCKCSPEQIFPSAQTCATWEVSSSSSSPFISLYLGLCIWIFIMFIILFLSFSFYFFLSFSFSLSLFFCLFVLCGIATNQIPLQNSFL